MAKSLQEQLLKAGLIDKNKAQKIKTEKRKKARQQPKGQVVESESQQLAKAAMAEKAEKDRQLNLQKKQEAEQKAILAQIKQLIQVNAQDKSKGDIPYQISDDKKVKKLNLTGQQKQQVINGLLVIVKLEQTYELVPKIVADKISQRDPSFIIVQNEKVDDQLDEDDPYADYEIPDDLMW